MRSFGTRRSTTFSASPPAAAAFSTATISLPDFSSAASVSRW
jgi:hypothetical protein